MFFLEILRGLLLPGDGPFFDCYQEMVLGITISMHSYLGSHMVLARFRPLLRVHITWIPQQFLNKFTQKILVQQTSCTATMN
jgi:hypothetical protein